MPTQPTSTQLTSSQARQLDALLKKGYQALNGGHIKEASECCRQALQLKPDLVQAHFLLGLVALEAKDRDTAFRAFASVTKLQKSHAAAWAQLAKLFITDGQVNRADAALANATQGDTNNAAVQDLLGSIYSLLGEHRLANTWFAKATESQPDHPPFLLNLANNFIYLGETDPAMALLGKIIALQPDSPQAHWSISGAQKAQDASHIKAMQKLLESRRYHPRAQSFFYYGIGKEFEDLEQWDSAFDAFNKGAMARRQTVEFDEATEIAMFEFLEENFDQAWLEAGKPGHDTRAPIFVLGQPRTGTTLIERIISSHSQVHSSGELQQLGLSVRRLGSIKDPRRFSVAFFEAALALDGDKLGQTYMSSTQRVRGSTSRFVDKLPQNYLLIPLILKALPNAKIIHLTRDPMDACFASFKQLFADAYLHSYDLQEMARHHCRYQQLMSVWRERFPDKFLDVSYEETVDDLEGNAKRMIDYLELPWEQACLQFHKSTQAVSTASAVQVREPVHSRSIGRWLKYEQQLEPVRKILNQKGII